jgi:hypothetical protein
MYYVTYGIAEDVLKGLIGMLQMGTREVTVFDTESRGKSDIKLAVRKWQGSFVVMVNVLGQLSM